MPTTISSFVETSRIEPTKHENQFAPNLNHKLATIPLNCEPATVSSTAWELIPFFLRGLYVVSDLDALSENDQIKSILQKRDHFECWKNWRTTLNKNDKYRNQNRIKPNKIILNLRIKKNI